MALEPRGFWSYAHADDAAEQGRIVALGRLLESEYGLLTGENLGLFTDRNDLAWGDEWREAIDRELAGITFFIPIVTPRYLKSRECRRELLAFTRKARSAGLRALILPILYVDVPGLDQESSDEAFLALADIQREDWQELRLKDATGEQHRQGVNRLALRIRDVVADVSRTPVALGIQDPPAQRLSAARDSIATVLTDDRWFVARGEEGVLDVLLEAEEALPRLTSILNEITDVLGHVAELSTRAAAEIEEGNESRAGLAGRLQVAHNLAVGLAAPAERLVELGSRYASELSTVDLGFLTLIDLMAAQSPNASKEERRLFEELAETIRTSYAIAAQTVKTLSEMTDSLTAIGGFSRELRAPIAAIQDGLQRVVDGHSIMEEWVHRLSEAGLGVEEPGPRRRQSSLAQREDDQQPSDS